MKNNIAGFVHAIYAYTVACALGMIGNTAMVLLAYAIFANPKSQEILSEYCSNNGLYFFGVTLILGLALLPFTINFTLTREITT